LAGQLAGVAALGCTVMLSHLEFGMSFITLFGAFRWECEECGLEQYENATEAEVDADVASSIVSEHFETLEAQGTDKTLASPELVTRVLLGPPFVTCVNCGKTYAAQLPVDESQG
jgi:hypothetical protein